VQDHEQVSVALECGHDIIALLAEMQDEAELFASANSLVAVEQCLLSMAHAIGCFEQALRARLVEVDWGGWRAVHRALVEQAEPRNELIWYAVQALVPATMGLMRRLWRQQANVMLML